MADGTARQGRDEAELPAADEQLLRELTERARTGGLKLTGEGGLLGRLTKMVVEGALEGELDDHLGYGKHVPPYAHELNPVELVWSHLKRSLANLAKRNLAQLTALAKTRLRRMQYRVALLDGFLGSPRLDLAPLCTPALKDRPSSMAEGC